MNPDELKQVWQSQTGVRRLNIDADVLLREFRRNKRHFISEVFLGESLLILGLGVMAAIFAGCAITCLKQELPAPTIWGFFSLGFICAAIAVYKAIDRIRQMKRRPAASDPVQACVEENLDWVQHEIRLWSRQALWWYLLPLAIGELLLFFSVRWAVGGLEALLDVASLADLLGTIAFVWAGQWFLRWCVRKYHQPRQRELESLLRNLQST
jgi:hypothetical protein